MKKVQDPDRPHGYKPRKVTAERLETSSGIRRDFERKTRSFESKPCDVCGASATSVVHNIGPAFVRRFPSLYGV